MPLTITDDELAAMEYSPRELRAEIALTAYRRGRVSGGWAAAFAGMDRWAFQELMGERDLPLNYDAEALKEDLRSLGLHEALGRVEAAEARTGTPAEPSAPLAAAAQ